MGKTKKIIEIDNKTIEILEKKRNSKNVPLKTIWIA